MLKSGHALYEEGTDKLEPLLLAASAYWVRKDNGENSG